MKIKRFLAVTLAATMVINSGILAFAEGETDTGHAEGTGIVEYDDSTAVAYDKITVPTINTADKFSFRLDPTHQLNAFEPSTYDKQYSVYFTSTSAKANLKVNGEQTGVAGIAYQEKTTIKQDQEDATHPWKYDGIWTSETENLDIVEATETEPAKLTFANGKSPVYYVWSPDSDATASAKYTAGLPGKWVALTTSTISNWFEPVDEEDISAGIKLKEGYNIEEASKLPIDGRLYVNVWTDIPTAGITDSAIDPLSNYATVAGTTITAVNLGTKNSTGSYVELAAGDAIYTPAVVSKVNYSDEVTVVNKSTKDKVVSAVVTLKNVEGLTFKTADSYTETVESATVKDETASIYVAVDDGSEAKLALVGSEDGKTATVTYTKTVAAKEDGDEITYRATGTNSKTGGYTYKRYEGNDPSYSSNTFKIYATANTNAEAAEAWKTWAASIESTARPSIDIVYRVTDAAEEEEEEEETPVEPTEAYAVFVQNNFWLGTADGVGFDGLTSVDQVTAFTINDVDVLSKATVGNTFLKVTWSDASSLGVQVATSFTIKATIDGTNYVATFTAN